MFVSHCHLKMVSTPVLGNLTDTHKVTLFLRESNVFFCFVLFFCYSSVPKTTNPHDGKQGHLDLKAKSDKSVEKSSQNDLLGIYVCLLKTLYNLEETKRKLRRTSVRLSQSDPKDNVFINTKPISWFIANAYLGDFPFLT